jgi:DNA mismatch endonuclease, patch repair protein
VLGPGESVPYPEPTSEAATKFGKGNRRRDTACEIRLRSALHARGLRFRKDLLLRTGDVSVHADVAFTRARVAVFVDGCFWHSCPTHGRTPKSNLAYWLPKLEANLRRDQRVTDALEDAGWLVRRAWEHEDPVVVAAELDEVVRARSLPWVPPGGGSGGP